MLSSSKPSKDERVEYLKGSDAEKKIFDYLIEQNRPHNPADICANLKVIKKPEVVRCLNNLHENQKIEMKLFGKQSIYCCKQSDQVTVVPADLEEKQKELETLNEDLKKLKERNKELKNLVEELSKQPLNSEIPIVKNSLRQQWIELQNRLNELSKGDDGKIGSNDQGDLRNENPKNLDYEEDSAVKQVKIMTTEQIEQIDQQLNHYKSLWINRSKTCKEVFETIKEGIEDETQRQSFLQSIELETEPQSLIDLKDQDEIDKKNLLMCKPSSKRRRL
ncbi:Tat binding protein 1-interacting protein-domain-containing protein [Phakopsora pachyrhizi]|nr:Tat binding protein 1-interacting protein-domain-containing protein [Phakopsora pachyrhizi]